MNREGGNILLGTFLDEEGNRGVDLGTEEKIGKKRETKRECEISEGKEALI